MISTLSVLTCSVTLFVSLLLPPVFLVVYALKNRKQGIVSAWLLGAVGFVVPQLLIRAPMLQALSANAGFRSFAEQHIVIYGLGLAFTAGLFEMAGRFAVAMGLRKKLTYRDLSGEDFIIMQPKGRPNDEAEEVMLCYNRGGFVPNIIGREKEVQNILLMVSAAFGIAILPEYAVRYFHGTKNLRIVPLFRQDGAPEVMDFEVSWAADNHNPAVERLLEWIRVHEITE